MENVCYGAARLGADGVRKDLISASRVWEYGRDELALVVRGGCGGDARGCLLRAWCSAGRSEEWLQGWDDLP